MHKVSGKTEARHKKGNRARKKQHKGEFAGARGESRKNYMSLVAQQGLTKPILRLIHQTCLVVPDRLVVETEYTLFRGR